MHSYLSMHIPDSKTIISEFFSLDHGRLHAWVPFYVACPTIWFRYHTFSGFFLSDLYLLRTQVPFHTKCRSIQVRGSDSCLDDWCGRACCSGNGDRSYTPSHIFYQLNQGVDSWWADDRRHRWCRDWSDGVHRSHTPFYRITPMKQSCQIVSFTNLHTWSLSSASLLPSDPLKSYHLRIPHMWFLALASLLWRNSTKSCHLQIQSSCW